MAHCEPLAQDYTVIYRTGSLDIRTDAPSLVRLPSGRLLTTFVLIDSRKDLTVGPHRELRTLVLRSEDNGASWEQVGSLDLDDGLPFLHDGRLYLLCNRRGRRDILVTCSSDEGETWASPVTLFEGRYWNTVGGHIVQDGQLYWAFGQANAEGAFNAAGSRAVVVAGDLSRDLMAAGAWRISPSLTYPGTPNSLRPGLYARGDRPFMDHWLEPNVVSVQGRVRVLLRLRIDGYATSHLAAVCDVTDDREELGFRFTQFHPMPGAQNNFHIIRDGTSGLFWTPVNMPTRTQDLGFARVLRASPFAGTPGNERRILALIYSVDALNWFQAGCIAMWPSPLQGFQYAAPLVDGDDLLIASRTSEAGRNQHDNDLVTLHRVRDFGSLALDVHTAL